MISKELIQFLKDLKENNYKEWFHENKPRYQKVKKEFEEFVNTLIIETATFDKNVTNLEPKKCIFRINRDIRFSKDKSPYKTNFGGFLVKGGRNAGYAGYYVHIEPGNSFIGGGIYMPPADKLKAVRTDIYENSEEFKAILNHKDFKKHFKGLDDHGSLKTAPKGFPKDFPDIDLLKHKHFVVGKSVDDSILMSPDFKDKVIEVFKAMLPLNNFLNQAIEYHLS